MPRSSLARVRRLVVKVGTGTLTDAAGRFDRDNCHRLAAELAAVGRRPPAGAGLLRRHDARGASGSAWPGVKGRPWDIATKQACAAVGQPHLMDAWGEAFGGATASPWPRCSSPPTTWPAASASSTPGAPSSSCLDRGVVPVVNENDTVAVDEIKVGDNDTLAGAGGRLRGGRAGGHAHRRGGALRPRSRASAARALLHDVERVTAEVERMAGGAGSERSTGGMATKVKAARRLSAQGVATALLSGRRPGRAGGAAGRASRSAPSSPAGGGAALGPRRLALRGRQGQGASSWSTPGPAGPSTSRGRACCRAA